MMPELITSSRSKKLAIGNVLMVNRRMNNEGRHWTWRYFFLVTAAKRWAVRGMIIGTHVDNLKDKEIGLGLGDERNTVWFLPEDEWPEGVTAYRMRAIMRGLLPDL
jgi:hypothetical protein